MAIRPLTELAPGCRGRLLDPRPGEAIPRRMRELGFVPGTELFVVRWGTLGDPVEIELRGYRVCVRRAELAQLQVLPLATP